MTHPADGTTKEPLLSVMPLHTITTLFGEEGLRERLTPQRGKKAGRPRR